MKPDRIEPRASARTRLPRRRQGAHAAATAGSALLSRFLDRRLSGFGAAIALVAAFLLAMTFLFRHPSSMACACPALDSLSPAMNAVAALANETEAAEGAAGSSLIAATNALDGSAEEAAGNGVGTGTATGVNTATSADATADTATDITALVPELLQYPDMPAGCETYSLAAILQALDFDADPHEIVANHLPFEATDGWAASAYSGSPYTDGEGLPPAIVAAGNSFLEEAGATERFLDATGAAYEDLEAIADAGTPVLLWTTMYLSDPGISEPLTSYSFYPLEHCLVLLGSTENGTVRVMDPLVGYTEYDRAWFQTVYELCGSMAVELSR